MNFEQALEELKDPYKGLRPWKKKAAIEKDKKDKENKKRSEEAKDYVKYLLSKKK